MAEDPSLDKNSAPGLIEYIQKARASEPFYIEGAVNAGSTMDTFAMPTIEHAILSCGHTRAFPYTDMRTPCGKDLLDSVDDLPAEAQIWTPLSKAFSNLQFQFLDGYSADFAFELRQDNRLQNFRRYLRSIWKAIDGSTSADEAERHARDLADELESAYAEAQSEWKFIHQRFNTKVKQSATSKAFSAVAAGVPYGTRNG